MHSFVPPSSSPFIFIDAHILATPAIGDLDGDGIDELVVPVSYFFDRDYYAVEVCFEWDGGGLWVGGWVGARGWRGWVGLGRV